MFFPPNSVKFFAASELLEQVQDRTLACKGHERIESVLAKEKCQQKNRPSGSLLKVDSSPSHGEGRTHSVTTGLILENSSAHNN
ncbi:MAG: hypothetical protein ABR955_05990 [Verrucomicrobiota bacterium]|jgi:hypothetical protein